MDKSKVIYVSGYRSFELGVFKENDPKIQVVKNVLKKELHQLAEEGLEWVLVSGNLGVELWAVQIVAELKEEYPRERSSLDRFFDIYAFLARIHTI